MPLIDINKLSGASLLIKKFPHLSGARVDNIFNAIYKQPYTNDDDGNFILRSRNPNFRRVNIDDGRHSVQRIEGFYRVCHGDGAVECTKKQHPLCKVWNDIDNHFLYVPGPHRNYRLVEEVTWSKECRKHYPGRTSQLLSVSVLACCAYLCFR